MPIEYKLQLRIARTHHVKRNVKWATLKSFDNIRDALILYEALEKIYGKNTMNKYRIVKCVSTFTENSFKVLL